MPETLAETALILPDNLGHKVSELQNGANHSLRALLNLYFVTEVAGQAGATIVAKKRDLSIFLTFYENLYGHDRPGEWFPSVTRQFIKDLAVSGMAQATIARTYSSVRRFARWAYGSVQPFVMGCPVDGVKAPREPEGDWQGLSKKDEHRLLHAAETLRARPGRGNNTGLRDHALLCTLLGTGLRISEVLNLNCGQFTGRGFEKVKSKGGDIRDFIPMERDCRDILREWLDAHPDKKGVLFPTRTGKAPSRQQAYGIIRRIAEQANAHLKEDEKIIVSPHIFRHTFLRRLADKHGIHHALSASGHHGKRYIWRYIQPGRDALTQAVEELGG